MVGSISRTLDFQRDEPKCANTVRSSEIAGDVKKFTPGKLYRFEEFADCVWGPDVERSRALPPETLFRYAERGTGTSTR